MTSFSSRHGLTPSRPGITIREDAPYKLRWEVVTAAYNADLLPLELRKLVCVRLREAPVISNTSPYDVTLEVRNHLNCCAWHYVYDIIEDIAHSPKLSSLAAFALNLQTMGKGTTNNQIFHEAINNVFREEGIGWKLVDGEVTYRGDKAFEHISHAAPRQLDQAELGKASSELKEAFIDLSRRPNPDLSGAIHHAEMAVECVMQRACGNHKKFSHLVKDLHERGAIPTPLNTAVEKLWGYASQYGRHGVEDKDPHADDVELVVHVAAAVAGYLSKKVNPI